LKKIQRSLPGTPNRKRRLREKKMSACTAVEGTKKSKKTSAL
jgi:hypothetical protein